MHDKKFAVKNINWETQYVLQQLPELDLEFSRTPLVCTQQRAYWFSCEHGLAKKGFAVFAVLLKLPLFSPANVGIAAKSYKHWTPPTLFSSCPFSPALNHTPAAVPILSPSKSA